MPGNQYGARFAALDCVEEVEKGPVFNEFAVRLPVDTGELVERMFDLEIAPGLPLGRFYPGMENYLLIAVTEKRTRQEIDRLVDTTESLLCR